jgi:hypothetical protein
MRGVAFALAAVFWAMFLAFGFAIDFEDVTTPLEMHYVLAFQTVLGVAGIVFTLIAAKPSRKSFWQWVSPQAASLPFIGWSAVAGVAFTGALFAPDSNVRVAFAIAFGLIAVLFVISSALPWAISQRVKTAEILKMTETSGDLTAEGERKSNKPSDEPLSRTSPDPRPDQRT